jgi:hypothetical protein
LPFTRLSDVTVKIAQSLVTNATSQLPIVRIASPPPGAASRPDEHRADPCGARFNSRAGGRRSQIGYRPGPLASGQPFLASGSSGVDLGKSRPAAGGPA